MPLLFFPSRLTLTGDRGSGAGCDCSNGSPLWAAREHCTADATNTPQREEAARSGFGWRAAVLLRPGAVRQPLQCSSTPSRPVPHDMVPPLLQYRMPDAGCARHGRVSPEAKLSCVLCSVSAATLCTGGVVLIYELNFKSCHVKKKFSI